MDAITIRGARTHNLRGVTVQVPKHRVTVFTGVSGSGKSSLVFGTIAAQAQRLVADGYPLFVRSRLPQPPAGAVEEIEGLTFTTVVDQRPFTGNARSTVGTAADLAPLFRLVFSRVGQPSAGYSPAYSFNDPSGMCPRCEGLGEVADIDLDELIDDTRSLNQHAVRFATFAPGTYRWKRLVHSGLVDPETPWRELPADVTERLLFAEGLRLEHPGPDYPKSGLFDGIVPRIRDSYLRRRPSRLTAAERADLQRVVRRGVCPECEGARVNAAARRSLIEGRSIADWSALPLVELGPVLERVAHPEVGPALRALQQRVAALVDMGLGYLSADRRSGTLSGGEAQRVKLVRHLGSGLTDVCYVFDEPSTGLHPHDLHRLSRLIRRLQRAGNTVLVVDHHPVIVEGADRVIDLGPGAGPRGGRVVFAGTPQELAAADTATGRMLRQPIELNPRPRVARGFVRIEHARRNNLRDLTVEVPLGVLTVATGVAGSGKSSLFAQELARQHPFTVLDQRPLGGGARSSVATVLALAEPIRAEFARRAGVQPAWFSRYGRGGCPVCRGRGTVTTDLAFLDEISMPCEACGGSGFGPRALAARVAGVTIVELMGRAADDLPDVGELVRGPARWLSEVGLGHLALGRSVDTLSGGERQRLRLARYLAQSTVGSQSRLVLDEPTAGLHGTDVDTLLGLLDRLVDRGATVVAIEHNPRVIARADHVVDLGPGAGSAGGRVVYQGAPRGLLTAEESVTGEVFRA